MTTIRTAAEMREAAAKHLDTKADTMRGSITGDTMARIFEDEAAAIRAIQIDTSPVAGEFVLVPRVPTEAMVDEALAVHETETERQEIYDAWNALLAAAPSPAPVASSAEVERLREAVEKVRDGYKSQMRFCDIEAMGYFREFVRRIDAALNDGGAAR